jgi:Fe-S oxidoreductase
MDSINQTYMKGIEGYLPMAVVILFFAAIGMILWCKIKRMMFYAQGRKPVESGTVKRKGLNAFSALLTIEKRFMKDPFSAIGHEMMMAGFMLFMIAYVTALVQVVLKTFLNVEFLKGTVYTIQSVILNLTIIILFLGSLLAIARRASGTVARLERTAKHFRPLVVLLMLSVSGIIHEGIKLALYKESTVSAFAGLPVSKLLDGLSQGTLLNAYVKSWYVFMLMPLVFLVIIPGSKMFHATAAMMNAVSRPDTEMGRLKNSEISINKMVRGDDGGEDETVVDFGVNYLKDLTPAQLQQLDCCAECGRCDSVCPANLSKKSLGPQKFTQTLKRLTEVGKGKKASEIGISADIKKMVWDCNMCYSCEAACPAMISRVDEIAGVRRSMVLNLGETEPEFKNLIRNMDKSENPFGLDNTRRTELINKLGIPTLKKGQEVDFVLWIGCHGYFDPRMENVVKSLVNILRKAEKSFAVLNEEVCCGDSLRRIGEEMKYQEQVYKNIGVFNEYKIGEILTICPHCFNTFKNEYTTFGSQVKVNHYLEILPDMLKTGDKKTVSDRKRVFYHDSCYLGRINNIYNQPRKVLALMNNKYESVRIKNEKEDSLCCGGGGGGIWKEENVVNRPSLIKLGELKAQKIDKIITSCPYCISMYSDAVSVSGLDIKVMDLLELIEV